ncbi:MAG: nodulation protein NfeD [Ideonella sp.]|nr:nodulation protein NfeD [Ideonella sp.]MCC7456821.1 nodulation protein NfeD [Nitrospira sp.]
MPSRHVVWLCSVALGAALWGVAALAQSPKVAAVPPVLVVQIDGAIGPAAAERVTRALDRAVRERAQLVVLQLDTPGGLDTAMRTIIKAMLASPVPVATFVAPQGARAASAGTYILYASHIAAMAPATNLGAATPIAIGLPSPGGEAPAASAPQGKTAGHDALEAKRVNDASAYIRSLAQLRGRDAAWGERAVREAVSLPATDALKRHVIDLIAADVPDLLRRLDARVVRRDAAQGGALTLHTAGAAVVVLEPDWRDKLLAAISDPSLALVLMMVGFYGLLFEFMNPGYVAPGVIGGVALLLALWGLQMLPINYAGLALILLGIAFFVGEAFVPSYGTLGIGGVAAFALGAVLLVDSEAPGFAIPWPLIAAVTAVSAVVVVGVAGMAARARRRPVVSGSAATLVGAGGTVIEADGAEGWADVNGERWRVRATMPLQPGQRVRVTQVDGLTLGVKPTDA